MQPELTVVLPDPAGEAMLLERDILGRDNGRNPDFMQRLSSKPQDWSMITCPSGSDFPVQDCKLALVLDNGGEIVPGLCLVECANIRRVPSACCSDAGEAGYA
jgi:hypothetical protein